MSSTGHDHGAHAHPAPGHSAVADGHAGVLPPPPSVRSITPAPEDFQQLPGPSAMLWPLVWAALAVLLLVGLFAGGWHLVNMPHHEDGGAHPEGTPHDGAPHEGTGSTPHGG